MQFQQISISIEYLPLALHVFLLGVYLTHGWIMDICMRNPSSQIALASLTVQWILCLLLTIEKIEGFYFYDFTLTFTITEDVLF